MLVCVLGEDSVAVFGILVEEAVGGKFGKGLFSAFSMRVAWVREEGGQLTNWGRNMNECWRVNEKHWRVCTFERVPDRYVRVISHFSSATGKHFARRGLC